MTARSPGTEPPAEAAQLQAESPDFFTDLVPELMVTNLESSLRFWRDVCGFTVRYDCPEERMVALQLGNAQVVLEEITPESSAGAPLTKPLGRGMNLQITVPSVESMLDRLAGALIPLVQPPRTRWFRVGGGEVGMAQLVVQDPDGYLLRFSARLGTRPVQAEEIIKS